MNHTYTVWALLRQGWHLIDTEVTAEELSNMRQVARHMRVCLVWRKEGIPLTLTAMRG